MPGAEERHKLTHLPYSAQCGVCIAAKARDCPHRRVEKRPGEVPVVEIDYGFMRSSAETDVMVPLLVAATKETAERKGGYAYAMVSRSKGRGDREAILGL
eukprot:1284866-Heterocapsa_arctica.AAC.1